MGFRAEMFLLTTYLALATLTQAQNVDIPCGASGTFDVSDLGPNQAYRFTSHGDFGSSPYGPSDCRRKFRKGNSCDGLRISCSVFNVTNSRPERCSNNRGDTLQLRNDDDINQRFCGTGAPDFITMSAERLRANFRASGSGPGFECFATCSNEVPPPTPSGCNCGQPQRAQRIVGGSMTEVNEYPWMVALLGSPNPRNFFCGGAVISANFVLSAAHCVDSSDPSDVFVRLGDHRLSVTSETDSITLEVASVLVHPNYRSNSNDFDYAILRLSEPIDFDANPNIRPICMPTAEAAAGQSSVTTGWGDTAFGGSTSDTLQEVSLPIVDRAVCNDAYGSITRRMVCAGDIEEGGIDACQGDSGGPLIVMRGNNYELNGLTSFGRGCAMPGFPGVWASVHNQLDWIFENTELEDGLDGCPRL